MSRRNRRNVPTEPVEVTVTTLSHDGRGIAEIDGKKLFVQGALPGERVLARLTARKRRHDEAETVGIREASPDRVQPACPHFGLCGGCALQHLDPAAQIAAKQDSLLQNLQRIGNVTPERVLDPLTGPQWNYRRKARLSVRYVHKKARVLIGFRERQGRFVADMQECHVLETRIAERLPQLTRLVDSMDARERIAQIEVACGDRVCALVFRHLEPLNETDLGKLKRFSQAFDIAVFLQSGGTESIRPLHPHEVTLDYSLPGFDLVLEFGPSDFIQINAELNRKMIQHALRLLRPGPQDSVLDLFCGMGNFTLPIARLAGKVAGIEGDMVLVEKARRNAIRNRIENVSFHVADLTTDTGRLPWMQRRHDMVLIDPPRTGALQVLPHIAATGAYRLVYISCHPASLARDAGILAAEHGFQLLAAGVMDMFPHTGHVESIALFERKASRTA